MIFNLTTPAVSKLPKFTYTGTYTLLDRSEEHTSELQSPQKISYAVFCLKKKKPRLLPFA